MGTTCTTNTFVLPIITFFKRAKYVKGFTAPKVKTPQYVEVAFLLICKATTKQYTISTVHSNLCIQPS